MDSPLLRHTALRPALLCLLLGLLLQGQAAMLRQLLGANHWHRPAAGGAALVESGWQRPLVAHQPRLAPPPQAAQPHQHHDPHHHHGDAARHHHGAGDASVVALAPDGSGQLSDGAAGSLLQPLALAGRLGWLAGRPAPQAWPPATAADWRSTNPRLPDRPPQHG